MDSDEVIGWIAASLTAVIFLSPLSQFINLFKGRIEYEDAPMVLIGIIYCNCIAWYVYGKLVFASHIQTCCIVGCGLSLFFIIIYLAYEIKKYFTDAVLNTLIVFTGTWAAYRALTINLADPVLVGRVCIAIFVVFLMYPLHLLYRVIKEKNYTLVSMIFSIFIIVPGILWAIYGFFANDYFIISPSFLAVLVGIVLIVVRNNIKNKYHTIEHAPEISTIDIENIDDENFKKLEKNKISEESLEEGEKIKVEPVKIINKPKKTQI